MAAGCLLILLLLLLSLCGCGRGGDDASGPPAPDSSRIATLAGFDEVLAEHAANLDGSFRIRCTPELHALLVSPSAARPDTALLDEIRSMNGSFGCTEGWDGDTLVVHDISYYAGWRILHAVRNGHESRLDARERETLRAAKLLVAGTSGSPAERERRIHDALCERIEYHTDGGTQGDKDCAVGALLDGIADCDGYADAMVLCCGLAGIPCRYMHGAARDAGTTARPRPPEGEGHMWNLVEIAGRWVSVDATWDDQEDRFSYLSYNLGTEDAAQLYRWDPRAVFLGWAAEADSATQLMPDQQRTPVRSLEEVYRAARRATAGKVRRFTFVCPGTPLWQTAETEFHRMLGCGGWKNYRHSQSGRMLEVTDIHTAENIRFCDKEEDALGAIREFAAAGIRSFSLHFRPGLADALFADDRAGLKRLLSRSLLEEPGSYGYSPDGGSVSLENATFTRPLPVCHSEREILSLLRRELAGKPASLAFLLADGLRFSAMQERVFDCVRSMGVDSFSWSSVGDRIRLLELEYPGEFRVVETLEDVAAYLRSARRSGKTALRIHCPPDLYAALEADNARVFWEMLEDAGYADCSVYSNARAGMLSVEP